MMRKVAVITDSTACLPADAVRNYGISVVPVELTYQGRVYRDGVDITPTEVYQLLTRDRVMPTTSAPPPGAYLEVFQKVSRIVHDAVVITVASTLSHIYDSACTAVEMAREKRLDLTIKVIDCLTAAGAQGLVVLNTARAAAAGKTMEQVVEAATTSISSVRLIAFLDTMHYLARGGRVPQAVAWAGNLLQIKPIMQIKPGSGQVSLLTKVRTRKKAIEQLLIETRRFVDSRPIHAVVMHSNSPADAEYVRGRLASEFRCSEAIVSDFTPVMGIHTGPGLLGIAFYEERN